jgi:GMP synthase (glutamine-hydrolysing)
VFATGLPGFGSCWAAQLAAVVTDGACSANALGREMGIARKIYLTDEGRAHPMYEGKPGVFDAFTSHTDEISLLPSTALKLASSRFCNVQAITVRQRDTEFWGVQYHPEYNLQEMARLTFCRIPRLLGMGFFQDEAAALRHVDDLQTLHDDPTRKDLRWKLGIDADVLNPDIRSVEARNWIRKLVLPQRQMRIELGAAARWRTEHAKAVARNDVPASPVSAPRYD